MSYFYDDRPHKGTSPADLQDDENSDSAGYADPLGNAVCAFAWVFIIALVIALTWAYQAGALPLLAWG